MARAVVCNADKDDNGMALNFRMRKTKERKIIHSKVEGMSFPTTSCKSGK